LPEPCSPRYTIESMLRKERGYLLVQSRPQQPATACATACCCDLLHRNRLFASIMIQLGCWKGMSRWLPDSCCWNWVRDIWWGVKLRAGSAERSQPLSKLVGSSKCTEWTSNYQTTSARWCTQRQKRPPSPGGARGAPPKLESPGPSQCMHSVFAPGLHARPTKQHR